MTETGLAIFASCLATLRPLFRNFFSRKFLEDESTARVESSTRWPGARNQAARKNKVDLDDALLIDIKKKFGTSTTIGARMDVGSVHKRSSFDERSMTMPIITVSGPAS